MKKTSVKSVLCLLVTLCLVLCFGMTAGADGTEADAEAADPAEKYFGILSSDETAIDFLEGYWTNGRSDYIYASRGNGSLINWQTNLPYTSEHIYVLEDGVFKGKSLNEMSQIVETPIFTLEIIDEDTIRVMSLISGDETEFTRDSFAVDEENLSNEYVFRTMDRASVFLEGDWISADLDYIFFSVVSDGSLRFDTNLSIPEGDLIDFCDGQLCAITVSENGKKTFAPALGFDISDRDTIVVKSFSDDKNIIFVRNDASVDPYVLDTDYVFSCNSRAYAFLEGRWKTEDGAHYFELQNDSGNVSWKTDLELGKHYSYIFAGGRLVGIDYDEEGVRSVSEIFRFDVIERDELKLVELSSGNEYVLRRG